MIVNNLARNAEMARKVIAGAIGRVPAERTCACARALETAIITPAEKIPEEVKRELGPIIGKYMPCPPAETRIEVRKGVKRGEEVAVLPEPAVPPRLAPCATGGRALRRTISDRDLA